MKRKILTESEKKQLVIKTIRKIIREEIERSLEESLLAGQVTSRGESFFGRLFGSKIKKPEVPNLDIVDIYEEKKKNNQYSYINTIVLGSLHKFLINSGFPNIQNFHFNFETTFRQFLKRLNTAYALTNKEASNTYDNEVENFLIILRSLTITPAAITALENNKNKNNISIYDNEKLSDIQEKERKVKAYLNDIKKKYNYLLSYGSRSNLPTNVDFIDMGQG